MRSSIEDGIRRETPRLEEVSDGIYAYVQPDGGWCLNNAGFLVGRGGVVSVDTCSTEARTRAYIDAIRSVTDLPVRTLINTHHHPDHTAGNYLFPEATVVAHEHCREIVLAEGIPETDWLFGDVNWGDLEVAPPVLTFNESVAVYVDELRCEVRHVGVPAHTINDVIVWVPDRSVLFTGDLLFNGGTPFVLFGSIAGSFQVLEGLKELAPATIVPGHGDVCGPETIDEVLAYLRFVDVTARVSKAAGLSPLEAAREVDLGPYSGLLDHERIVGNLHRAYAELDGAPFGAPIDHTRALEEMVVFNGGKPLTCHT